MDAPNIWAIAVIVIGMLAGPQVRVATDQRFDSKATCEAGIAASVPAKLDAGAKREWEDGYRQYVCVRLRG